MGESVWFCLAGYFLFIVVGGMYAIWLKGREEINSEQWLEKNGYGGLLNFEGGCGCESADLCPCGIEKEERDECTPGYKHKDPRTEHAGDYAIWAKKETPSLDQWESIRYF